MLESTQIAFTIVIATLIALIYIFYNVFFKKQQSPVSSQENNTESENKQQQQQQKQKDKKQNLKPVKTKETLLKHSWLSATLKGKFFF
jgi:amino acid permease